MKYKHTKKDMKKKFIHQFDQGYTWFPTVYVAEDIPGMVRTSLSLMQSLLPVISPTSVPGGQECLSVLLVTFPL